MNLASTVPWLQTHWFGAFVVTVWLIANFAPRPLPNEEQKPIVRLFWLVIDRLCILTAAKVPGNLKWILAASPAPVDPTRDVLRDALRTNPELQTLPSKPPPDATKGDKP